MVYKGNCSVISVNFLKTTIIRTIYISIHIAPLIPADQIDCRYSKYHRLDFSLNLCAKDLNPQVHVLLTIYCIFRSLYSLIQLVMVFVQKHAYGHKC